MYIVYSGVLVKSSRVARVGFRQIYRFDYLEGGIFGSLRNLNYLASKSATKPYTCRWQALREGVNKEQE